MYPKFVASAIGQINPNASLSSVGKTCKRLTLQESSPIQSTTLDGTCENLQTTISQTLENG